MIDNLLQKLKFATTENERHWIVTESLLSSLSKELEQITWAAAIPHWFNEEIIKVLCPDLKAISSKLFPDLLSLPFIVPLAGRGYCIHEKARKLMLEHLWKEKRKDYVDYSSRMVAYFDGNVIDPYHKVERIYHLIIANPQKGSTAVRKQCEMWNENLDQDYVYIYSLTNALREHDEAGRIGRSARGWRLYWEGVLNVYSGDPKEGKNSFMNIDKQHPEDIRLIADAYFRLGDLYLQYEKNYQDGIISYKKAQEKYRSLNNKVGEAACIYALGTVYSEEGKYKRSLVLLKDAYKRFRGLKQQSYQIKVLFKISEIYDVIGDHIQSIEYLELASTLIGKDPAKLYISLMNQFLKLNDIKNAEKNLEFAEKFQPGHPSILVGRGRLLLINGQDEDAYYEFREARRKFPYIGETNFYLGYYYLLKGKVDHADSRFAASVKYAHSRIEICSYLKILTELDTKQPALYGLKKAIELFRSSLNATALIIKTMAVY